VEFVTERDQRRPADWLKAAPINTNASKVRLPLLRTSWVRVARVQDVPKDGSITIKHGTAQLAIFNFASRGEWYACQNMCPHTRDMVLARGIIGDQAGQPKVACPMHKKTFSLATGDCLSGEPYSIRTFPVKIEKDAVFVELPPIDELERLLDVRKPKQACATQACSAQADATQQSI
jgi:nitrite reductase (NADH) large subunit